MKTPIGNIELFTTKQRKGTVMSADNGYIIRLNQRGKYVLQMYFASAPEFPPINKPGSMIFTSLEEAVNGFNMCCRDTEYGLRVDVKSVTPDPVEVIPTPETPAWITAFFNDPEYCKRCGKRQYVIVSSYLVGRPVTHEITFCTHKDCIDHCLCYSK